MIPQTYPLYAVRNARTFLVVGWVTSSAGADVYPMLAPLDRPDRTYTHRGPDVVYTTTAPKPYDPDATATIPAARPVHAWPRPQP
jgi:hypothetical protein